MNIQVGRNNLSATVYIPVDCDNGCQFCTSKAEYKKVNKAKVIETLKLISNSAINEIVFTGGEVMNDIKTLREMVEIVSNKTIYINTTFINKNIFEFVDLVNNTKSIKGINISRHSTTYQEDCKTLCNIAVDEMIKFINKPVRINVVIDEAKFNPIEYLNRWNGFKNVTVNFRANYNNMTEELLHPIKDKVFVQLGELSDRFLGRTYCDVCDTSSFEYKGLKFAYHRGLPTTSIQMFGNLQINDIIVFPDGELCYDWNRESTYLDEVKNELNIKVRVVKPKVEEITSTSNIYSYNRYSCGTPRGGC